MAEKIPPVISPDVDLPAHLRHLVGETGILDESMGGYRIKICHARMFPWDDVIKALVYRDYKIYIAHHKADVYLEAQP